MTTILTITVPGEPQSQDRRTRQLRAKDGRCETCLAADLLERYGLDVTTPQWSRDENGRIVTNWHPSRPPKMEDDE